MPVQLVNGYVLIPQKPDWADGMEILLQWQTEIALAKRGFEDRASLRPLPMAQLGWQVVTTTAMDGAALEDCVRAALRSGQACVPCWPRPTYVTVGLLGASVAFEATQWPWTPGDYFVAFDADGTPYVSTIQAQIPAADVFTITTPIPLDCVAIFPLVFGRFEAEQGEQEGPDTLLLNCRLYIPSWRLPGAADAPTIFFNFPLIPAAVVTDWSDAVNRTFAYDPSVEQIGFGVETLEIEQSYVQHGIEMSSVLQTDSQISDLENFIGALGGRRGNFWLPGKERAMIVTGALSSTSFLIEAQGLADTWGSQPDLYLYFSAPGQAAQAGRISSVVPGPNGTEQVILDAALPVAVDAGWDVFRLRLMRFSDDKLTESYDADGSATVRVVAVELPLEYFAAAPVTPQPAYLYAFKARLNGNVHWYQTSHATAINFGGNTYAPTSISHAGFKRSMDGSDEKITVTSFFAAGGPLAAFLPFPPSDRLQLIVYRLDLGAADPASTAVVEFQGFVANVRMAGRKLEAEVQSPIDYLARKLPAFIVGTPCNAQLFGPGCNLNADDWKFASDITIIRGTQLYVADGGGHAANYFAGGHLITGVGAAQETRTIMSSSNSVGQPGNAVLVLNYPFLHAQVGQALTLWPGCTHLPPDCTGKFNNFVNYQGHPLVPYRNPTIKAIDVSDNGSGKKS